MYVFVCMHTCVRVCTRPCHSMAMEVSGQPLKADSLYPLSGSQRSNSGLVANILTHGASSSATVCILYLIKLQKY